MNNQIKFVRNEKGEFVRTAVSVTKTVVNAALDVAAVYANFIRGLLDLTIRIGLFCLLWPYIFKFIKIFIEVASQVANQVGGWPL